jgi:hypothetical protein
MILHQATEAKKGTGGFRPTLLTDHHDEETERLTGAPSPRPPVRRDSSAIWKEFRGRPQEIFSSLRTWPRHGYLCYSAATPPSTLNSAPTM